MNLKMSSVYSSSRLVFRPSEKKRFWLVLKLKSDSYIFIHVKNYFLISHRRRRLLTTCGCSSRRRCGHTCGWMVRVRVRMLALLNINLWATSIRSQRYKSLWNVFIFTFLFKNEPFFWTLDQQMNTFEFLSRDAYISPKEPSMADAMGPLARTSLKFETFLMLSWTLWTFENHSWDRLWDAAKREKSLLEEKSFLRQEKILLHLFRKFKRNHFLFQTEG